MKAFVDIVLRVALVGIVLWGVTYMVHTRQFHELMQAAGIEDGY